MTDEYQIDNVTWAEKDSNGNIVVDPDVVNTNNVSANQSHRQGRTVYFNPADTGPYIDGTDAVADVPAGGTLKIAAGTEWDVATQGRISVSRGMTIRGEGWTVDENNNLQGTRIINTGGDTIDAPVIEFSAPGTTGGSDSKALVQGLATSSEAGSSAAIHCEDFPTVSVVDTRIEGDGSLYRGIDFNGTPFFSRVVRSHITGATNRGVMYRGGGNKQLMVASQVTTKNTTADSAAVEAQRPGFVMLGGQVSTAGGPGAGVRFYNPETFSVSGGVCYGVSAESADVGFEINGDSTFSNVKIADCETRDSGTDSVLFGNTADCSVWGGLFDAGNKIHWTADSARCGAVLPYGQAAGSLVDDGASQPFVIVPNALTDGLISNIDTTVDVHVPIALDHGSAPAMYDSSAGTWKHLGGATTNFAP